MRRGALLAALAVVALAGPSRAQAMPLFEYEPLPPAGPPPDNYIDGPCGLAVDSAGRFYVADYYHHTVDIFDPAHAYVTQLAGVERGGGPCQLAIDSSGRIYIAEYHGAVKSFGPEPSFAPGSELVGVTHATGVAADPMTGRVYVDERTYIGVYEPSGAPVEEGGAPLRIGEGTLQDGYGLAVSGYSGTEGFLYVPDAATDTVDVYDPIGVPVETIFGPPGGFVSLRDSAVAVDAATGEVYVLDDLQPGGAFQPLGVIGAFDSSGAYEGHLEHAVVDGEPSGLAVDNSASPRYPSGTQGRVYVTSGNSLPSGIYAYPPAVTTSTLLPPSIPQQPRGAERLTPTVTIGKSVPGGGASGIECEGDACQLLPPEPTDPTLTTLLAGPGNPKVRYHRSGRHPAGRHRRRNAKRRHQGKHRSAQSRATASRAVTLPDRRAAVGQPISAGARRAGATGADSSPATASAVLLGGEGFSAQVIGADGKPASLAGSHPYQLDLDIGLDQGGGEADLRAVRIDLPPGLLADPAATPVLCSATQFATPRSSPYEASGSGENCPASSQVGTVEVRTSLGAQRRFGLFDLEPGPGAALELGASPYGVPLVLRGRINEEGQTGAHLTLEANPPEGLHLKALSLGLWGAPWDAVHDGERGSCLNEAEPAFPWCKAPAGAPLSFTPAAFLTLPTSCSPTLSFAAAITSWQQPGETVAGAINRSAEAAPVPAVECASLNFEPHPEAFLTTKKASSASGFAFRFAEEDPGLANPRGHARGQLSGLVLHLPAGVTLNPSLGSGLGVCTPAQFAAASSSAGNGCSNQAKIGGFSVHSPFYEGFLSGGVYLAAPHENPFGSLLALYLVAKAADRGIMVKAEGKIDPDPGSGNLTISFEGLPQIPYSNLEVTLRSGQRAPLVSPDACGAANTAMQMTSWAQGTATVESTADSPIETGIEGGPCPGGGAPPFSPGVVAGGVNSNVGSYTPYFVHLKRKDTEQEITSYSLTLPKGITAKLAGIPQCPDAAIAAARANTGFAEAASPSCPAASQVGRTLTGYGVGATLTYAEGKIYLAGPYHGTPLSLVTVNPVTVGPFDLGTVVVRSAFDIDPLTAQLSIDSRASDRIPHIIDGIPLHLRDIRIYMDRHEFTHNPSSCEPSELVSTLTGAGARLGDPSDDSTATATEHFQLLNCLTLGFQPKLGLRLRGSARRGGFPALRASFVSRGAQDSNLKRIEVDMPHQLFLAQNHIRKVCTRPAFEAGTCPAGSVYGTAVAYTPLLDTPLRSNVYLRSSSHKLPDLVADLHSGSIRIILEGRIGPSKQGGIQAFFDNLPDAPIERFTMLLRGGKHGLLTNSVNVCVHPPVASVKALGQNDKGSVFTSVLRGRCPGKRGRR
jgi:hypothetical protein